MIVFHKAFQLALNLLSNLNIIHENSKTGITIACIIQCIINFLLFVHTKVMVVLVLTMLQVLKRQKKVFCNDCTLTPTLWPIDRPLLGLLSLI